MIFSASCSTAQSAEQNRSATSAVETNVTAGEPHIFGVRLRAKPETLTLLEEAARKAGWTEIRSDRPGSILILAPEPYDPSRFGKLLDSFEAAGTREFSLQLLGPDGRPVDADGNPMNET